MEQIVKPILNNYYGAVEVYLRDGKYYLTWWGGSGYNFTSFDRLFSHVKIIKNEIFNCKK